MKRRTLLASALALPIAARAQAATKLGVGFTTADSVSAFAAKDMGYFAQAGLDANLSYIAMNSNMPAALVSDSLQIGCVTTTVLLQAVDNGIDLVALAGTSSIGPENAASYSLIVRTGVDYGKPADLVGKRIGVPGFGAIMHVLLVEWLRSKGVDTKGVQYVEATFVSMADMLKAGTIDAVLAIDPFTARIVGSGVGRVVGSFADNLPKQMPGLVYVATRSWAEAHRQAAQAARGAIVQGANYANANPDAARTMITNYTHVPAEVVAHMHLPLSTPELPPDAFAWMIEVMRRQDLLRSPIDQARLLFS